MAANTIFTTAGIAAMEAAGSRGPQITVASAQIGSDIITPSSAMTGVSNYVYTVPASAIEYVINGPDTVNYKVFLDGSVGPFNIGNIGLFLSDGTMISISALTSVEVKDTSNTKKYNIFWQFQGLSSISNFTLLIEDSASLPEVANDAALPLFATAPYDVYLVDQHSEYSNRTALAMRQNSGWKSIPSFPITYADLPYTPVHSGGGTNQDVGPIMYMGFNYAAFKVKVTVNSTDFGNVAFESWAAANFYPLASNPAGYLTSVTFPPPPDYTNVYYPRYSNPTQFITAAALAPYATDVYVNSTFYPASNPSAFITYAAIPVKQIIALYQPGGSNDPSPPNDYANPTLVTLPPNTAQQVTIDSALVCNVLGFFPANKHGETFTGNTQFNSNLLAVVGPGSGGGIATASPVDDGYTGMGWNTSMLQVATQGGGPAISVGVASGSGSAVINQFWFGIGPSKLSVGSITCNSSTTYYNTTSDYRLKEVHGKIENALDTLMQANFYRVHFINDDNKTEIHAVLAHEFAEIVPQSVNGKKDGTREAKNIVQIDENNFIENVSEETFNLVQKNTENNYGKTAQWQESKIVEDYQQVDLTHAIPLIGASIQELKNLLDDALVRIHSLEQQLASR